MQTELLTMGRDKGIILPTAMLEQCNFHDQVEINIHDGKIVISCPKNRSGWEQEFQRMARSGDDQLLDEMTATDFEQNEWSW